MPRYKRNPLRKVMTAQSFRLVDAEGKERGEFALDHNDNPYLVLRDRRGRMRAQVCLPDEEGNPAIGLDSDDGKSRILLTIGADGTPRLWFYDGQSEEPRLGLTVDNRNIAAIDLWDSERKGGISVSVSAPGDAKLTFWQEDEKAPRLGFHVKEDGTVVRQEPPKT